MAAKWRREVEEALLHLNITLEDEDNALTLITLGVRLGLEAAAREFPDDVLIQCAIGTIDPAYVLEGEE